MAQWAEQVNEAEEVLRQADTNLLALENEQMSKRLAKYTSPALGRLSTDKPEEFKRFMVTQLNGASMALLREIKIDQCTQLIKKYDVDVMTYGEHGLNMGRFKPSETFDSFF